MTTLEIVLLIVLVLQGLVISYLWRQNRDAAAAIDELVFEAEDAANLLQSFLSEAARNDKQKK